MANMSFYHRNYDQTPKMFSKLLCALMLCMAVPNVLAEISNFEHSSDNRIDTKKSTDFGKLQYNNFDLLREDNVDYNNDSVEDIMSYDTRHEHKKVSEVSLENVGEVVNVKKGSKPPYLKEESVDKLKHKKKRRHGGKHSRHSDERNLQNGDRTETEDWRDGDFVMTDVLGDGEKEKRIRYMGISAKETTAGSNGVGLLLRQLTDGRHFIQVIADLAGKIIDCEYVHEKTYINDFLKQFNQEISVRGALHDGKQSSIDGKWKKYKNEDKFNFSDGKKYKYRETSKKNQKYSMKKNKYNKNIDIVTDDYNVYGQYEKDEFPEEFQFEQPHSRKKARFDDADEEDFQHAKKRQNMNDDVSLTNVLDDSDMYDKRNDNDFDNRNKRSLGNGQEKIMRDYRKEADFYTDLYNSGTWNDFNDNLNEDSEENFESVSKESFRDLNSNGSYKKSKKDKKIEMAIEYNQPKHQGNKRAGKFPSTNELEHGTEKNAKVISKLSHDGNRKNYDDDFSDKYDDEFIERTYNGFQNRPRMSPRRSIHGLYNVTVFKLDQDSLISKDLFGWLDYAELERKCDSVHAELSKKLGLTDRENGMNSPQNGKSRARRSLRQFAMMPGTLWCGSGQLANTNSQLGELQDTDVCCRAHDACPGSVPAFHRASGGVINKMPYSLSKCECDRRSFRRRTARSVLVPGTLWCGRGYSASSHAQLGAFSSADRCCRSHDMRCPFWIAATETKYGLFNWRPSTLMHCRCDERFRSCLKLANTDAANMVGQLFFNVVQTKCFVLKPAKVCMERSWWGKCSQVGYAKMAHLRDNLRY